MMVRKQQQKRHVQKQKQKQLARRRTATSSTTVSTPAYDTKASVRPRVLPSSMFSTRMMMIVVVVAILTKSVPIILQCHHPVHRHVEAFSFSLQHHRRRDRRGGRRHQNAAVAGGLSSISDLLLEARSTTTRTRTRIAIGHQNHRHFSSLQASSSSSLSSSSSTTTTWNSTTDDDATVVATVPSSTTAAPSSLEDAINVFPIPTTESTSTMDLQQPPVDEGDEEEDRVAYKKGLATIGFITLLFSSNSPALHAAFSSSSSSLSESAMIGPPPVLLLNGAVSLVALVGLTLGGDTLESKSKTLTTFELDPGVEDDIVQDQKQKQQTTDADDDDDDSIIETRLAWVAGCELGLWKTLGTVANIWGLALTSASHGALLIQLTTLIVPVVQGIQGVPIPPKIRVAVILALAGVVCFTQDTGGGVSVSSSTAMAATDPNTLTTGAAAIATSAAESTIPSFEIFHTTIPSTAVGDALCVVAAVFYSVYDLRLFVRGKQVPTKALITRKIATQALLSMMMLIVLSGNESTTYIQATIDAIMNDNNNSNDQVLSWSFLLVPAVVLWSGIAVNAVAPYLQVGGQQVVGPTRCQTIYASQPLWAALLSFVFLGETIGERGLVGGTIFVAALFLAATAEIPDPDCEATNCEV
mmetsp:Transcript_17367/g.42197  ORF Transcript_17367/g.42197 Transcript_17367/m.42197 type:complete len:641 (+) Transcript_17367:111-2033(+)